MALSRCLHLHRHLVFITDTIIVVTSEGTLLVVSAKADQIVPSSPLFCLCLFWAELRVLLAFLRLGIGLETQLV